MGATLIAVAVIAVVILVYPRFRSRGTDFSSRNYAGRLASADRTGWSEIKNEFADIALKVESSSNKYLGRQQVADLRSQLEQDNLDINRRIYLQMELWSHLLRLGDIDAATAMMEETVKMAEALPSLTREQERVLHWNRALNYLRVGEVTNCVLRHNSDCCILPLRGGGSTRKNSRWKKQREASWFCYNWIRTISAIGGFLTSSAWPPVNIPIVSPRIS